MVARRNVGAFHLTRPMLFVLSFLCTCEKYPLIIGVPAGTAVPRAEVLGVSGVLPENLCIFIVDQYEEPQIRNIHELSMWGNSASKACENVGKMLQFPAVESAEFNFVERMMAMYDKKMFINSADECACKIRHYRGGLVIVRVLDSEPHVVEEIRASLLSSNAIAFVAATPTLFTA